MKYELDRLEFHFLLLFRCSRFSVLGSVREFRPNQSQFCRTPRKPNGISAQFIIAVHELDSKCVNFFRADVFASQSVMFGLMVSRARWSFFINIVRVMIDAFCFRGLPEWLVMVEELCKYSNTLYLDIIYYRDAWALKKFCSVSHTAWLAGTLTEGCAGFIMHAHVVISSR